MLRGVIYALGRVAAIHGFFRKLFLSRAVEWYICRLWLSGIAGTMAGCSSGIQVYWPLAEGSEQIRGQL